MMAYSIQYEDVFAPKRIIPEKRKISLKLITVLVTVVSLILVWCITPVRLAVLDFLLPGDGAVTRQAAGDMIQDLKQGAPFKEAFTDFCIEILQNA